MTDDVAQAIGKIAEWAVREWIAPRLPDDPELNHAVAVLARALAARLDGQPASPPVVPKSPPPPPLPPAIPISQLPPLNIGSGYVAPLSAGMQWEGERELDLLPLTTIADRCRVKGDACKLVSRRLVDASDRSDLAEDNIIQRAQALPDCHLWMLSRDPIVTA